ncbi:MAG: polysaccharide biosynthesis/export family protein [Bacteroidota bacterium]
MSKALLVSFFLMALLFSCTPIRQVIYFQQGNDSVAVKKNTDTANNVFELRIYPSAILAINVFTVNSEAIAYFTPIGPIPADPRSGYERGFVVDPDGFVDVPMIGSVKLSGLTLKEAKDTLTRRLKNYIQEPVIAVKLLSFKFTVLGEVNKPGQYFVSQEKITFPEALGVAGDLTAYGRRTNIKLIRSVGKNPMVYTIDLTTRQVLSPEFAYVYPEDVIYVEPVKRKNFLTEAPAISIVTSITTTAIVLLSFILSKKY